MGVGAGLYMYVVIVQKFTFAISSPDEFLYIYVSDIMFTDLSPVPVRSAVKSYFHPEPV